MEIDQVIGALATRFDPVEPTAAEWIPREHGGTIPDT
jgi:hypothetical protein